MSQRKIKIDTWFINCILACFVRTEDPQNWHDRFKKLITTISGLMWAKATKFQWKKLHDGRLFLCSKHYGGCQRGQFWKAELMWNTEHVSSKFETTDLWMPNFGKCGSGTHIPSSEWHPFILWDFCVSERKYWSQAGPAWFTSHQELATEDCSLTARQIKTLFVA